METKDFDALKQELKGASEKVRELVTQQSEELKRYGETSKETADKLVKAEGQIDGLLAEKAAMEERLSQAEVKLNRKNMDSPQQFSRMTPGQRFLKSEEVQEAIKSGAREIGGIDIGSLYGKAVISNATVGDGDDRAPVFADRVPELFFDPGQRELTIRDIMNVASTSSNAIEYFQETEAFDSGSAASQDGETNDKNQMEINFEKKTATVETIAAWLPASRQVLSDSAQLQSHIDSRLVYKVNKEVEDQVIFGDGTSGNLLGIHNTPGVQTAGPIGSTTILDYIRQAFAAVRVNEYMATAIILHPNDWSEIELQKGSDNHYIWVTVPNGGAPRLWRVPVVESTVMEEGRFLTGAFGIGAQLWDRESTTIRVSEHHSNYFVKNAVAILAETRLALTVYRPKAFIKGVLSGDVST